MKYRFTFEPPHDKTNKMSVCPAKTQISLGIRPVWLESSLSAWRKLGSLATHWAHSEDSDQTGRMPRLIWVFAGRTYHFVGFVMRRLILKKNKFCMNYFGTFTGPLLMMQTLSAYTYKNILVFKYTVIIHQFLFILSSRKASMTHRHKS